MAERSGTIRLYTSQAAPVCDAIRRDGVCYSREEYVQRKYAESAPVFLTAYRWYVKEAARIVPPPAGAEFPYWAFADPLGVAQNDGGSTLTLDVPVGEAVFFDMYDWYRVLQMKYMGADEKDERSFAQELSLCGLRESDVMLTAFYPELKQKIMGSWQRLFRHHGRIAAGDCSGVGAVQAGLWRIDSRWIAAGL